LFLRAENIIIAISVITKGSVKSSFGDTAVNACNIFEKADAAPKINEDMNKPIGLP
jgi:hypothetical protein